MEILTHSVDYNHNTKLQHCSNSLTTPSTFLFPMNKDLQTPIQEAMQQLEEFKQDAEQFWNRSTVYSKQEYIKELQKTGMALGVLGAAGYAVKLVCLPLVSMLVG